jgi:hypothetical protein
MMTNGRIDEQCKIDDNINRSYCCISRLQQVGLVAEDARRSVAQFSLPDADTQCECGFQTSVGGRQSVIALCNDGTYHRFTFTSDGNCTREGFDHFLDLGDEQEFWTDINWAVPSSI